MTVPPPGLTPTGQRLFDLLPVVHRLRDADQGNVLRELLEVLAGQVDVLSEEISQLYDDQFIETCTRWVAPYIGDLIGYRVLHGVVPEIASPRAEVANTIAYRRRKGTAAVLEQLAHDVTGWPARAVEFFERVVTTQYMNHPRPNARATVDMRNHEALAWMGQQDAAFDDFAHTGDVRRINAEQPATRGRHNVMNVAIFLWRTEAVPVARSPLIEHADGRRFRFDALGADEPLFGLPRTEEEITHLAETFDVPLPLGRRFLADHVGAYYGARRSILLEHQQGTAEPTPIALADVRICDLSDVPGGTSWAHEPPSGKVAIDPVLGRVFLGTPLATGERVLGTSSLGLAVPVGAAGRLCAPFVPTRGLTHRQEVPLRAASRRSAGGPHRDHAQIHEPALRRPGVPAAHDFDGRCGPHRRRRPERDGREPPALHPAAREQPDAAPGRVPPLRPRGRVLLRNVRKG